MVEEKCFCFSCLQITQLKPNMYLARSAKTIWLSWQPHCIIHTCWSNALKDKERSLIVSISPDFPNMNPCRGKSHIFSFDASSLFIKPHNKSNYIKKSPTTLCTYVSFGKSAIHIPGTWNSLFPQKGSNVTKKSGLCCSASTALEDKLAYLVVDLYSNHYQRRPLTAVIPMHFMGWTSICNISYKLQNSSKRTANYGICLMVWPFQKAILYFLWQEPTDCQLEMLVFDFYDLTLSIGFSHAELTLPSVEPCLFRQKTWPYI